jgi:hypothetical protein
MKQNTDEFARRLHDDAEIDAPDFSDMLHIRLMAAVCRENLRAAPAPSSIWRFAIPTIATAIIAIASAIWFSKRSTPIPPPTDLAVLPTIPSLEQVVRETADPMRQKLKDARFAYLDRDGKRLARFLWRSVPGTPAGDKHEPDAS